VKVTGEKVRDEEEEARKKGDKDNGRYKYITDHDGTKNRYKFQKLDSKR